ncbi:hypothetical protein PR048_019976 [Dryococelus australis]|uniref:Uncharacterized protein n=1 Tax=Dryococelus australis TaxID=614101 RepID=A0ABQ9H5C7_9NEOP|nr:hypothetical protein PR048_019976 [Dryococelus australis]
MGNVLDIGQPTLYKLRRPPGRRFVRPQMTGQRSGEPAESRVASKVASGNEVCGQRASVQWRERERLTGRTIDLDARVRSRIFAFGIFSGRSRWSVGFLGDHSFPPPLHSGAAPYSPRFTLIVSENLDVMSRPNLFTHSTRSVRRFTDGGVAEARGAETLRAGSPMTRGRRPTTKAAGCSICETQLPLQPAGTLSTNPGSIPGPAILISAFHGFPKSLQANAEMSPSQRLCPIPSPIPLPCITCTVSNDLAKYRRLEFTWDGENMEMKIHSNMKGAVSTLTEEGNRWQPTPPARRASDDEVTWRARCRAHISQRSVSSGLGTHTGSQQRHIAPTFLVSSPGPLLRFCTEPLKTTTPSLHRLLACCMNTVGRLLRRHGSRSAAPDPGLKTCSQQPRRLCVGEMLSGSDYHANSTLSFCEARQGKEIFQRLYCSRETYGHAGPLIILRLRVGTDRSVEERQVSGPAVYAWTLKTFGVVPWVTAK